MEKGLEFQTSPRKNNIQTEVDDDDDESGDVDEVSTSILLHKGFDFFNPTPCTLCVFCLSRKISVVLKERHNKISLSENLEGAQHFVNKILAA